MEWTITVNDKNRYAEIVTSGIADRDGSLAMAKEISMTMSQIKLKKILIDHRNISSVSGETVEIYHRPKEFEEIGVIQDITVAELVKPEHREFFNFLETVCANRGFLCAIFEDRKTALEWLLKS